MSKSLLSCKVWPGATSSRMTPLISLQGSLVSALKRLVLHKETVQSNQRVNVGAVSGRINRNILPNEMLLKIKAKIPN